MVFQKNKKRIETKDPDFRELFEKMQKENRIDSTLYKEISLVYNKNIEELRNLKLKNEKTLKKIEELNSKNLKIKDSLLKPQINQEIFVLFAAERFAKKDQIK